MQPAPGGSGSSSSGGPSAGELSRAGLARFRSAPATWLEALLEDDEEDPLKPNQCLTQLLTADTVSSESRNSAHFTSSADSGLFESSVFQRQNSSPANFLGNSASGSEGFYSNYGIPASYDYLLPAADVSPSIKRAREADLEHSSPSAKFSSQMKVGQSGLSGMTDADMERLLEDSIPCRVRAKRGFATHPRSIAERVRRTRISDRIRKLQDLVPNMDKQTNTADMLDEAVEYVKHLQRQIEELTEHQRKCQCKAKEVEEGDGYS